MAKPQQRLPLTTRVGSQPVMAMGLNGSELMIVIGIGFLSMIIFTIFGFVVLGKFHYGILFGFMAALIVGYVAKLLFVSYKRQTPDGYFQQILYRLQRDTIGNKMLITHKGIWDALRVIKRPITYLEPKMLTNNATPNRPLFLVRLIPVKHIRLKQLIVA